MFVNVLRFILAEVMLIYDSIFIFMDLEKICSPNSCLPVFISFISIFLKSLLHNECLMYFKLLQILITRWYVLLLVTAPSVCINEETNLLHMQSELYSI